jgi:P-type Cu+ transporter
MKGLSIKTVGLSLSALASVTYVLCMIWDLIFPGWAMYQTWQGLFPGFSWSVGGFVIGLVEAVIYSFYAAAIFVSVYNYLQRRETESAPQAPRTQEPMPMAHH